MPTSVPPVQERFRAYLRYRACEKSGFETFAGGGFARGHVAAGCLP